jgi:hypothetical protein
MYLNGEVFPLRVFDLRMGRIFYVAGRSPAVAARLRDILAARVIPAVGRGQASDFSAMLNVA